MSSLSGPFTNDSRFSFKQLYETATPNAEVNQSSSQINKNTSVTMIATASFVLLGVMFSSIIEYKMRKNQREILALPEVREGIFTKENEARNSSRMRACLHAVTWIGVTIIGSSFIYF